MPSFPRQRGDSSCCCCCLRAFSFFTFGWALGRDREPEPRPFLSLPFPGRGGKGKKMGQRKLYLDTQAPPEPLAVPPARCKGDRQAGRPSPAFPGGLNHGAPRPDRDLPFACPAESWPSRLAWAGQGGSLVVAQGLEKQALALAGSRGAGHETSAAGRWWWLWWRRRDNEQEENDASKTLRTQYFTQTNRLSLPLTFSCPQLCR